MEADTREKKSLLRFRGDQPADDAVSQMQSLLRHPVSFRSNSELSSTTWPALAPVIASLQIPAWASGQQLRRGSRFFQQHVEEIMGMLGLYALPYCYAAANGVRVLHLSRQLKDAPAKRFFNTAKFVCEVCEEKAFAEDGNGFAAILNIRLMHAAVRVYAQKLITDETPVNQEDMLGTMLSFSLIVLRGLRKLGMEVSNEDAEAYLHLWKVIGYLLGVEQANLPGNLREASLLERQIRKREFKRSSEGVELTSALLHYLKSQTPVSLQPSSLMYYLPGSGRLCRYRTIILFSARTGRSGGKSQSRTENDFSQTSIV